MLARFAPILLVLAVAGAGGQARRAGGLGTLRTDTATFVVLLIGVIVLVGALTFFPAILLGPIVQSLTTSCSDAPRPDQLAAGDPDSSPCCWGSPTRSRHGRIAGRLPRTRRRLGAPDRTRLLAQDFGRDPGYFHARPSTATKYNPTATAYESRAQQQGRAQHLQASLASYLRASGPTTAASRADVPPTRSRARPRASTHTSRRRTPRSRPAGSRPCAGFRSPGFAG